MADLIIRGMEMPKDCPHCEFAAIGYASPMSSDCTLYCRAVDKFKDCATEILKDKPYEVISHYNDRPDWCPLVPLPEGHGDLIDKQAFKADIDGFIECMTKVGAVVDSEMLWGKLLDALDNAKTIVPAEGGTDDV